MKAARYMRKPFVITGFEVTDDNMDSIAQWCEGNVIRTAEKPFVRVPVNRPTNKKQTEAYIGTWVLLSYTPRGEKSFKVYTTEWLNANFHLIPEGGFKTQSFEWIEQNLIEVDDGSSTEDIPDPPDIDPDDTLVLPPPKTYAPKPQHHRDSVPSPRKPNNPLFQSTEK